MNPCPTMHFSTYINVRTFIVLLLSLISCYIAIHYDFKIHFNIALFGLAIAFPLATSIQTAFKRREKALEYLGLFKAGMLAIHYSLQTSKKLEGEKKLLAAKILRESADKLLHELRISNGTVLFDFQKETDAVMAFIYENKEFISTKTLMRVIRYAKDVLDGATYLLSLTRHRTMIGLRVFSLLFINIFIVINAPILRSNLGGMFHEWVIYLVSATGSFILISLYNIQAQVEYPFDQQGGDDIKLDDFKLNI